MKLLRGGRIGMTLLTLASVAVALGILGLLVYRERDAFSQVNWRWDWPPLLGAFGLLLLGLLLMALVWAWLIRELGSNLPLARHFRYYVISHLGRRLPGTLWYVAGRSYFYAQEGESVRLVAAGSALELVLATVAGALVTLALWGMAATSLPSLYLGMLLAVTALGIVLVHPRVLRYLLRRMDQKIPQTVNYGQIVLWLAVYAVVWLLGGVMFYALAYSIMQLSSEHMLYVVFCWTLVGTLSTFIVFLPTNFGFTEIGLSVLLSAVMPSSLAVLVAVLSRVLIMAFEIAAAAAVMGGVALAARLNARTSPPPTL